MFDPPAGDQIAAFAPPARPQSGFAVQQSHHQQVTGHKRKRQQQASSGAAAQQGSRHRVPSVEQSNKLLNQALSAPRFSQGPLSLLQRIHQENKYAKVVIRRTAGVRGYCIGRIRAFDKHMNLILEDVTETFTQSEIQYKKEKHLNPALRGRSAGNRKRAVFVETEHTRQIPMLFVKGDSVVMIYEHVASSDPAAAMPG